MSSGEPAVTTTLFAQTYRTPDSDHRSISPLFFSQAPKLLSLPVCTDLQIVLNWAVTFLHKSLQVISSVSSEGNWIQIRPIQIVERNHFFTMQHRMYNVQITRHLYYEYKCIITTNLFSDEAHDMNQVCITSFNYIRKI